MNKKEAAKRRFFFVCAYATFLCNIFQYNIVNGLYLYYNFYAQ